ncbi:MAG: polysaccharide deacetylase family protein, partial [Tepidiformaceae bacterium]
NRGVEAAAAPICLFLDDDVTLEPAALRGHLAAQERTGGAIVTGQVERTAADPGFPAFAAAERRDQRSHGRAERPPPPAECFAGNTSFPTRAFREAGGFNSALARGTDMDFAWRLRAAGLPGLYEEAAVARQHFRTTTARCLREAEAQGRAEVELWRRYAETLPVLAIGRVATLQPAAVEVFRLAVRFPLPMVLFRLAGRLPLQRRGAHTLFRAMQLYWRLRGARAALADPATWDALTTGVRILCYHSVTEEKAESRWVLSKDTFAAQVAWLRTSGVNVIPLSEYVAGRARGEVFPRFTVVLTFDDGLCAAETIVRPMLAQAGFTATIFALSDPPGPDDPRPKLSGPELRSLIAAGFEVGAHSRRHPRLGPLRDAELHDEVTGSRAILSRELGCAVDTFAYPFGEFDARSRDAVIAAGYSAACAVGERVAGPASDMMALPRLEVRGPCSLRRFKLLLRLGRGFWHVPFI